MSATICDELEGVDLGDARLNQRSRKLLATLSSNSSASVNGSCRGWAETMAAYRFFENPSVTPEAILAPHVAATRRRMLAHPVVLLVQDTTELDFSTHPAADARSLNTADRRGLYDHTQLAVTPDKLCLGVVGSEQYARPVESLGKTRERRWVAIEERESFRWLNSYRQACRFAAECPGTRVVSVADCEADIYEIFAEAQTRAQIPARAADFVIRAKHDRNTPRRDLAAGPATYIKVWDDVRASPLRGLRRVELPQTPKRAARTALLELRAVRTRIRRPEASPHLPEVECHVVLAEERNGPGDGTDVSWRLLTTLPIKTKADLLKILDYYTARWLVEVYFRTLKTGCRVEEIQLETTHRLKNCLAFYKIIAWRILYLTYLQRVAPRLTSSAVFDESEWKAVWRIVVGKKPPAKPPSLAVFLPLLAQLGGYNHRPNEPPPGPQTLWIALRRMQDFAHAWILFHDNN